MLMYEKLVEKYGKKNVDNLGILNLNAKEILDTDYLIGDIGYLLDIGNAFLSRVDGEGFIFNLEEQCGEIEDLGFENFSTIYWDSGLGNVCGFKYFAPDEVYYVDRWIEGDFEGHLRVMELMLSNISRELDDNNLDILKEEIFKYWL